MHNKLDCAFDLFRGKLNHKYIRWSQQNFIKIIGKFPGNEQELHKSTLLRVQTYTLYQGLNKKHETSHKFLQVVSQKQSHGKTTMQR